MLTLLPRLRFHASHFKHKSLTSPKFIRTMSTPTKYDAIIIGSGQAGTPLAGAFAKAGQKTALIERTHIGGCCVNEGCSPTKTMVASGRAAYLARRGPDYGVYTNGAVQGQNEIKVDMLKVRQRKRDIVDSFRGGNENRTKDAGVDILMGEARFVDEKTINITTDDGSRKITGEKIFINTGERPVPPKLEGLEKINPTRVLDSTSVQELDVVPGHLVVIGGGYVGAEFAQLFRRLGAEVTIIQRGQQLLQREDKEVADTLMEILREDGLKIHLNSSASSITTSSTGSFDLKIKSKDGEERVINGTHILFAAGRIPNTEALNLPAAGVATNAKGYIVSNDFLETTTPNIFVLGDVKGPPAFTHISYDDFRIIKGNVLNPSASSIKLSIKDRLVPYVVYTDPQLGHIGLHEHEARANYPERKIKTAKMPMAYVARALETDESRGMMKAVIDEETGHILGFTCLGIEGGEVMSVVQMAMIGGVRYEKLRDAVWSHPSLAESLNNIWGFLE
jgi:pyruvate/2-oxoglutarate dehydrogenase complex dihydrolipoamide dehydrogenase (E3) component